MKILYFMSLFFAWLIPPIAWAEESVVSVNRPGNIQILLEKNASSALLEVRGSYYIFNPKDGSKVSSGLFGKRFTIQPSTTGIKWGEDFPGLHQLCIFPKSPETAIYLNGIQYDGALAFFKVGNHLNIINEVDIENFLKSILSSELPVPLEKEAMAALAIATRTTAYWESNRNPQSFWHIEAKDIHYQGSALIVPGSNVSDAVDATRHLILMYGDPGSNRSLFPIPWTEHCAGKTASFESIFRRDSILAPKGVEVPFAALDREHTKWSFSRSKEDLAALFGLSSVHRVDLFTDALSSKIYGLRLKGGEKEYTDIDFFAFQEKIGKDLLLSNDFSVLCKKDEVIFSGYGKGHGVGICLYSANAMAQNGESAVKILSKFFPNTFLINLSAVPSEGKR